uniref:Putative a-macroglobulin receptor n=1 Tax=Amblyomma triste TaxID=251400 RepID=A0A023G7C0_AMBTT
MNFKESSMRVCARSLENTKGMAILDVGLLTGFKPVLADLEEMVTNKRVDSFEHGKRSVVFYLQKIPTDADVCVEFRLKQEFSVGKLQSASVKAYAYYDPDISCTKFYSPDRSSALLKIECDDANEGQSDVCRCLEGGCPPQDIKEMFTKENGEVMKTPICRENFRTHACEKAEFVWLGTALSESHKDGFITIKFFISNVLKPGIESEEDLLNNTRIIKARENCESFEMKRGSQYIIMSMDAKYKEKDRFGDEQYVYMIDSESVVISTESTNANIKKQMGKNRVKISPEKAPCNFDKLVTWFVHEFSDESRRCFT